jgi:hypothetical protein
MLHEQTPDPNHCWARFVPRAWPADGRLWLDLFTRRPGRPGPAGAGLEPARFMVTCEDVLYLPPVEPSLEEELSQGVAKLESTGTPLLVHLLPGTAPEFRRATRVYDLLQVIATGDLAALERLPRGCSAVWPLIKGYTDDQAVWEEALTRLAECGVSCVQGIAADLEPADRRRIVELAGEGGFDKLFHGGPPSERDFAVAAHRHGLHPFVSRPLPAAPAALRSNRELAEKLALIGELWLRLGRAESRGQSFYRASRWVDREAHDLARLAREGNLGVVSWLDAPSRDVLQELATTGASNLLTDLLQQYLDPSPGET